MKKKKTLGYKIFVARKTLPVVPTPDIIAELERRRPCKKCGNDKAKDEPVDCIFCRWSNENISRPDNFKEAK